MCVAKLSVHILRLVFKQMVLIYSVNLGLMNTSKSASTHTDTHTQTNMNSGVFIEARKSFKVGFKNGPLKKNSCFNPVSLAAV